MYTDQLMVMFNLLYKRQINLLHIDGIALKEGVSDCYVTTDSSNGFHQISMHPLKPLLCMVPATRVELVT